MNEVYLIINQINGKKYIGVTSRGYLKRFKEHQVHAKEGRRSILYNAMRKYGIENFTVELVEANISDEDICAKEKHYIGKYNTFYIHQMGYNMTEGGDGMSGYRHTDETKQKMSNSLRGRKYSQERNEKIRQAMLGREYKPEWRKALSESRKGKFIGNANPFYGRKHSDETKQAIGEANTKHSVIQLDAKTHKILQVFSNASAAARWLIERGYTSALVSTCVTRISVVCKGRNPMCTAYGFGWQEGEKSLSTNFRRDDELPAEAQSTLYRQSNDIVSTISNNG